jgi:hypothetical protein
MIHDKMMVTDTKIGVRKVIHPKLIDGLVQNTTGMASMSPLVGGVITQTTRGVPTGHASSMKDSVMKHEGFDVKTQPKRYGQIPYAGRKY